MTAWINSWTPWREMNRLQGELNRMFGHHAIEHSEPKGNLPAVNIWQDEKRLVLTVELPGREPDDIDLTVTRESVVLRKIPRQSEESDEGTWYRRERSVEPVERTIELPLEVDPSQVEARYEKGVLTLELQRPVEHQPRKVTVRAV
jgi:HSP20 family protein